MYSHLYQKYFYRRSKGIADKQALPLPCSLFFYSNNWQTRVIAQKWGFINPRRRPV